MLAIFSISFILIAKGVFMPNEAEPSDKDFEIIENCLPELMSAESFKHPFYAQTANTYWANRRYIHLRDAILPTVDAMQSNELLGFADLLVKDHFQPENLFGVYATVWERNKVDVTVDADGIVHSHQTLGSLSRVKEFVREQQDVLDMLVESLEDEVFSAAIRQYGEEYAKELWNVQLAKEIEQRQRLHRVMNAFEDSLKAI